MLRPTRGSRSASPLPRPSPTTRRCSAGPARSSTRPDPATRSGSRCSAGTSSRRPTHSSPPSAAAPSSTSSATTTCGSTATGRRLIKVLEEQDPDRTNVTICDGACLPWRAPGPYPDSQDVQHLKFYLTEIGGVQSFITSSANLEDRQYRQYNSLLKIDDPGLYAFGLDYFARLEAQSTRSAGSAGTTGSKVWSQRADHRDRSTPTAATCCCPRCRTCRARRASRVSAMFAVIQRDDVRRQLARLSQAGCRVRIVTSRDTVENWMESPQPTGDIPDSRRARPCSPTTRCSSRTPASAARSPTSW